MCDRLLKNIQYHSYRRRTMAGMDKNTWTGVLVLVVVVAFVYLVDPTFFGLLGRKEYFSASMSGFENMSEDEKKRQTAPDAVSTGDASPGQMHNAGSVDVANQMGNPNVASGDMRPSASATEGFANLNEYSGPSDFGSASAPAGCYPRDQLTPGELLPKDQNSVWSEQNPMGPGSLKAKNFLSAGALIGVNTVGQSLRNANYQLRSEPPNPQVPVSIFNQSTIQPDVNRRPLEIS